jgi:hypothetical protein
MAGNGLSRDDRGVLQCEANTFGTTGESNGEATFTFDAAWVWSMDTSDGLSTGRVFDLRSGLGPREKFCVARSCAASEGWEAGNKVKLDRAGEVARR